MNGQTLPAWLRRAIRTWLQAFLASFLASLTAINPGTVPSLDWLQRTVYAALFAAGTATLASIVSALQNAGEDSGHLPPFLKTPNETAAVKADEAEVKADAEAKKEG